MNTVKVSEFILNKLFSAVCFSVLLKSEEPDVCRRIRGQLSLCIAKEIISLQRAVRSQTKSHHHALRFLTETELPSLNEAVLVLDSLLKVALQLLNNFMQQSLRNPLLVSLYVQISQNTESHQSTLCNRLFSFIQLPLTHTGAQLSNSKPPICNTEFVMYSLSPSPS